MTRLYKCSLQIFTVLLLASISSFSVAAEKKGPNGGMLLQQDGFTIELAIVEKNQPPAYQAWASMRGDAIAPSAITMHIELDRLGPDQQINFVAKDDFLLGDKVIFEPHSFVVNVDARYQGKTYNWRFDSLEGRTEIAPEMTQALGVRTRIAGPAVIRETERAYGQLALKNGSEAHLQARFDGAINTVAVAIGQRVKKGQVLARIESNESLKAYALRAPIDGIVVRRNANVGEQTQGRELFHIADDKALIAELNVFPKVLARLRVGAAVSLNVQGLDAVLDGTVTQIDALASNNQATTVRVGLKDIPDNARAGLLLQADVTVVEHEAALAVPQEAVQDFRDFKVVYAKFGNQYEVRMLQLGRRGSGWVEVLGGLPPGSEYVSENSFVIKADIEKSGASHDH